MKKKYHFKSVIQNFISVKARFSSPTLLRNCTTNANQLIRKRYAILSNSKTCKVNEMIEWQAHIQVESDFLMMYIYNVCVFERVCDSVCKYSEFNVNVELLQGLERFYQTYRLRAPLTSHCVVTCLLEFKLFKLNCLGFMFLRTITVENRMKD